MEIQNTDPPFSHYYDKVDYDHAEILEKIAKPCYSNKHGFTTEDKLQAIRELLKDSNYIETKVDNASIWTHKALQDPDDILVVSAHADQVSTITNPYSTLRDDGYYDGTYDNNGPDGALVITMLETDMPENVIFAFTADEETGRCNGVTDVITFCHDQLGLTNEQIRAIAVDVTYEGDHQELASIENTNNKQENLDTIVNAIKHIEVPEARTMCFVPLKKKFTPDALPEEYLTGSTGDYDEAFAYNSLKIPACSICLPCEGSMHSNTGLRVMQPVFEGYLLVLQDMIYSITKTHEILINSHKIERATLFERANELEELRPKFTPKVTTTYADSYFDNFMYDDSFTHQSNEYYYDELEADQEVIDEMIDFEFIANYDESEKEIFLEEALRTLYPDMIELLESTKYYLEEKFDDFQANYQDLREDVLDDMYDDIEKE